MRSIRRKLRGNRVASDVLACTDTLIHANLSQPRRPKSIAMIKCGPDDEWMGVNGSSVGIDERFKSDLTSL